MLFCEIILNQLVITCQLVNRNDWVCGSENTDLFTFELVAGEKVKHNLFFFGDIQ